MIKRHARVRRSNTGPSLMIIWMVYSTILEGAGIITIDDREILKALREKS